MRTREDILALLQSINADDIPNSFTTEQRMIAWAELARNEVVMGYLKGLTKLQIDDIKTLLVLDKDKRGILTAEIYGDLKRITDLLTKAQTALKELKK